MSARRKTASRWKRILRLAAIKAEIEADHPGHDATKWTPPKLSKASERELDELLRDLGGEG